jgi:superoxide dismutase, Fe-Mn family
MSFTLPALPYAKDALAPIISAETIEYHYGKHHQTYVDNLNKLVVNTEFANKTLEEIIKTASGGAVFNNAAQIWNHTFYWECLKPSSSNSSLEGSELLAALTRDFGGLTQFEEAFAKAATTLFGSGWAWLVKTQQGKLEIVTTSNAGNPLTSNQIPLLTCDVWEHAYYIDYRNARAKYVDAFWQIVNWNAVQQNYLK